MFRRLRHGMGGSASAMGGVLGAFDEIFNPAGARARREQHERVILVPSRGDKILDEGKVVIPRRVGEDEDKP